jgi:hypothetical protein
MYAFASPEDVKKLIGSHDKVVSVLPAEITFHVRRYSFAERVSNFFHLLAS